jgi:predicted dehydrogenase
VGSIGLRHLRNLRTLGYEDIILLRSGKSTIHNLEKEIRGIKSFSNLEKALDQKPDVCIVSNPTSLHVETSIKAAEAGCHLFIEKPVSHNLENLQLLEEIVEKNDLKCQITYQFLYHPHILMLKELLADLDNKYGRVVSISAEWSEFLPDWHPWEDYKDSYSSRKELGGGVLLTQIHPLNYLSFIIGEILDIKLIKTSTGYLDIDVDDTAEIILRFSNKVLGHIHVDFFQKPRIHFMKVVTTKGRFEWDYHENKLKFICTTGKEEFFQNNGFERNDMFLNMIQDFISNVEEGNETRFNLSDAVKELNLLLNNKN